MTNEEIIEQLELCIGLIKQNGKDWLDERDIPVLEKAIEVCKKEAPKKPRIKLMIRETLYRMYCPNCNGYLGNVNQRVGYVIRRFENQKYCGECGQLIDWPEEWL